MRQTAWNRSRRLAAALALAAALTGACEYGPAATGPGARPAAQGTPVASRAPAPRQAAFDEREFREDVRTAETLTDDFWRRHWDRLFTGSTAHRASSASTTAATPPQRRCAAASGSNPTTRRTARPGTSSPGTPT
ncbi:hypothetical protein ACFQY7_55975 [Actinomadura luteofluorescens]|uniref:hypothetical protein n=1 Tax=Actinomadura luteofluorescens TaxID=46163 RepID=UPI0036379C5F